jgi:Ran-binding protein 3
VNVTEPYEEDDEEEGDELTKKTARLLMRSDGVWRVILNSPVFKGMKAGDASGEEPSGKQVHLAGIENGRTVPFLLRVRSPTYFYSRFSRFSGCESMLTYLT